MSLYYYGALIQISLGYSPVKGKLHTRYSPVRRSPSSSKLEMLPLDLHVLGLSLAFILSQDQTLRCNKILKMYLSYKQIFCLFRSHLILIYCLNLFKEHHQLITTKCIIKNCDYKLVIELYTPYHICFLSPDVSSYICYLKRCKSRVFS